jgi:hypothetical protein
MFRGQIKWYFIKNTSLAGQEIESIFQNVAKHDISLKPLSLIIRLRKCVNQTTPNGIQDGSVASSELLGSYFVRNLDPLAIACT